MNRRRSLMLAAASGSTLASLPSLATAAPGAGRAMPPAAAFAALLGQRVRLAGHAYRVKAVRAQPSRNARIEQFSLVLQGSAALAGGLHALHHASLGTLHLQFSASNEGGTQLRADISRLA